MAEKTILVVDDEEHMLNTVQFLLEAAHYRVVTAKTGEEALEKIRRLKESGGRADLILTDIQMPGLTGPEFIDRLYDLQAQTPILVMTGYGDRDVAKELCCKGCGQLLDKPFEEEELLARVRDLLGPAA